MLPAACGKGCLPQEGSTTGPDLELSCARLHLHAQLMHVAVSPALHCQFPPRSASSLPACQVPAQQHQCVTLDPAAAPQPPVSPGTSGPKASFTLCPGEEGSQEREVEGGQTCFGQQDPVAVRVQAAPRSNLALGAL